MQNYVTPSSLPLSQWMGRWPTYRMLPMYVVLKLVFISEGWLFFVILVECQVDKDCPVDKACRSQECVDPCLTTACGTRALCEVDFHTAICVCPPGLQGNPLQACIEAGCSRNTDCASNEKCDFLPGRQLTRRECQPLCNPGICVFGADCSASDHKETCTCRHPLIGDGFVSCITERKLRAKKSFRIWPSMHVLEFCSKCGWTWVSDRPRLSSSVYLHEWLDLPKSMHNSQPLLKFSAMCCDWNWFFNQECCMHLSRGNPCWIWRSLW